MEPGDSGSRQSVHPSPASASEHHQHHRPQQQPPPTATGTSYQPQREQLDRRFRDQPAMATATVLAPSAHYPPQHSYAGYPQHPSGSTQNSTTMISSETRRSSDDKEQPSRQSLPSISEVISGARPGQYPPPAQAGTQPSSGLPSPFAPAPRQYSESDKHSSPQSLHAASFPPRQENPSAFAESPRPPFNGRHSLPPVSDRRATPPTKSELPPQHRLAESHAPSESHPPNGAYGHPHPPPTSHPYPTSHLPPGQVPLPNYPASPRHHVPHAPGPYDPRAPTMRHEEADFANNRARFDPGMSRHFETWSYQDSLSRIGSSSRTIFNFAEAYGRIAQEQHGSHPIPERLPTEREVNEMLANVDLMKRSLEQVKDAVQASIQSERAREGAKIKGAYEEDGDVPMYGEGMKPQYAMTEVKKRRGRAAPPGRCHSCNRIDTPEWRRGPDGARTLCNACGLHYAKLERKRQLEARSIRPKPEDRN